MKQIHRWLPAVISVAGWMAAAAQAAPQAGSAQPEMTTLKSTFVPGEKTIFYDDFTDMGAGDAPPHFKVRGAAPELQEGGGIRQLAVKVSGSLYPNLTSLPKNFTYEVEFKAEGMRRMIMNLILYSANRDKFILSTITSPTDIVAVASVRNPFAELGRIRFPINWNEPTKIAVWIQNGRMRAFYNGEKRLDFNQVDLPPIDKVEMLTDVTGPNQTLGYRTVRFAESTPDFSQVISSAGRYVSHGILFDTGSDRLKPESAPVIQAIAKGIETNPSLKLLIEGHTDSVGNAAQNLDLSKRRAEAVKAVLVEQFKVDAARLTTAGLGATKPMDSNDTPQGRSQNRRVEFVKQ
jgi:OmpA-OmpF porin, OOP family